MLGSFRLMGAAGDETKASFNFTCSATAGCNPAVLPWGTWPASFITLGDFELVGNANIAPANAVGGFPYIGISGRDVKITGSPQVDTGGCLGSCSTTAPADIAIIAPFRAQVRMLRSALQKKGLPAGDQLTVDTVERMQGQEREVVVLSLAVGDPDTLNTRTSFFFSTNRLNVAMSRARSKMVLVGSRGAFQGLPMDPEGLRAASLFKRLFRTLPQVDLTKVYGS
ncbi:MAG: hypothetical protein IIA27_12570 [Gemmatimonadetes bacterium]|nr:hypothetical protein [Gemmatimonadota bacterium]